MNLPDGFRLTRHGLMRDGEDPSLCFYDFDLYVTALAPGDSVTVKHFIPNEGWREFRFAAILTNHLGRFIETLAANGIKVEGLERQEAMRSYVEASISKILHDAKLQRRGTSCPKCGEKLQIVTDEEYQKFIKGGN